MATSDRVIRYLGSTRNIVGSVLALLGFLGYFLGLAGAFWPVVVIGLYGAGALLAPPERVRLTISHAEVETRQLRADLEALLFQIDRRFPDDVRTAVAGLADVLASVLGRAEVLTSSPEELHVVSQTIRSYLPASLEAYANLPRSYALARRADRERSAHEELLAQLALLEGKLREVADAVYRGDDQALRDQGRFLKDRFGSSELDL